MRAPELAEQIPGGARRRGQWYDGRCPVPAHGDSRPSLSFRDNFERKRIDLLCRAGCNPAAIAAGWGLSLRELFHNEEAPTNGQPGRAQLEATYPYRDESGSLLYEVVRFEPKDFRQRRPDGQAGWIWNLDGVRRVLYRLPELRTELSKRPPGHRTVFLPEGEKDVDRLREHGVLATCNPGGAGKWRSEYSEQLKEASAETVIGLPDNDKPGKLHAASVGRCNEAAGLTVKIVPLCGLLPKGDVSAWLDSGHTREELLALAEAAPICTEPPGQRPAERPRTVWDAARSAADLINAPASSVLWLKEPLLAPGSLTELFSPRGLGKTQIIYAIAVDCARGGARVLLLDRDNSKREVTRRLHAWGAGETPAFKVMTRDEVPPLTDAAQWATFPFQDYDLIIIDSLDATTEGVGEQDSAKPSKAIAPLLDIAHRAEGPAIAILGNTIKSGAHSRGSGVVEDRADICFEIRDATDLRPTGTKDWWLELPAAGVEAWADRASRRKRRDQYRLAFIASKFRIGEEPLPFALEMDLAGERWTYRDVTGELVQTGEQNREQANQDRRAQRDTAIEALREAITTRPLTMTEAVAFLQDNHGLGRAVARDVIQAGAGAQWQIQEEPGHGSPKRLHPLVTERSAAERASAETPLNMRGAEGHLSATRMDTRPQKERVPGPAETGAIVKGLFPPPSPLTDDTGKTTYDF